MQISDLLSKETLVAIVEEEGIQIHDIQGMFVVKIKDIPISSQEHIFNMLQDAMDTYRTP